MQCNKKSAEKVAEKQLKQKRSEAESAAPHSIACGTQSRAPVGHILPRGHRVMSLAMANPNRVSGAGRRPGGRAGRRGEPGVGSSAFTKPGPHSCDWDHNSSEQGYGIFNEYAYYWWGEGRGENQGRHITKMV